MSVFLDQNKVQNGIYFKTKNLLPLDHFFPLSVDPIEIGGNIENRINASSETQESLERSKLALSSTAHRQESDKHGQKPLLSA